MKHGVVRHNVGGLDQTIRWLIGAVLIIAAMVATMPMGLRVVLIVVGAGALWTAFTRYCPINKMLGRNSHGDEGEEMDV
jgi:hypothetical protein